MRQGPGILSLVSLLLISAMVGTAQAQGDHSEGYYISRESRAQAKDPALLEELLADMRAGNAWSATGALLRWYRDPSLVSEIRLRYSEATDDKMRVSLLGVADGLSDPLLYDLFVAALDSPSIAVKLKAIDGIKYDREPSRREVLVPIVESDLPEEVRASAVEGLGHSTSEKVLACLEKAWRRDSVRPASDQYLSTLLGTLYQDGGEIQAEELEAVRFSRRFGILTRVCAVAEAAYHPRLEYRVFLEKCLKDDWNMDRPLVPKIEAALRKLEDEAAPASEPRKDGRPDGAGDPLVRQVPPPVAGHPPGRGPGQAATLSQATAVEARPLQSPSRASRPSTSPSDFTTPRTEPTHGPLWWLSLALVATAVLTMAVLGARRTRRHR